MMKKKEQKITVKGSEISVVQLKEGDYISLTDMVKNFEDGLVLIEKMVKKQKHNRIYRYLGTIVQHHF